MQNSFECVRLLLEETNIDATEKTSKDETSVLLACKNGVNIEILESLLVSLRTIWPIEKVKEFLELKDSSEMRAYDYCKLKKRSDLAVVLAEFVDTSKSILDIGFSYIEGFDFKAQAKSIFSREFDIISKLDTKNQYNPLVEPFLRKNMKIRLDKCVGKQMKPLQYTPFTWIDTPEGLASAAEEM
jgi:hypothetical protein